MQCFSVLGEVLGASHQRPHLLERHHRLLVDLGPSPAKSMDGGCAERRDDGRERREVIESAAFLTTFSNGFACLTQRLTSAIDTKCLMTIWRRLTSACVRIICATQFVN